jgi:sterol desaturase/sphingolipid hydroxylase (fatty acid hydroxylase superfamily)
MDIALPGEPPPGTGLATGVFLALWAGALLWLESRRPLRERVEPKGARLMRNAILGIIGAVTVRLVELPVTLPLAAASEQRGWGLLHFLPLPPLVRTVLALALLDYTLYIWHVLTHRVGFLWRFHSVHHADLDLDASTALRFHAGELVASVPWRALQVLAIGVSPATLVLWQVLVLASTLFHHSDIELPLALERRLVLFVVTPRMHGIHHSTVAEELNSNWSNALTLWDRLHGTLRLNVPQRGITIGLAEFLSPEQVRLGEIVALPFASAVPRPEPLRERAAAPKGDLLG